MLPPPLPQQILSGQESGTGLPVSLNLPVSLCADLRFTPEQFAELCQANPEAVLELAADGSLILMTPTGGETGARNAELSCQIYTWARLASPSDEGSRGLTALRQKMAAYQRNGARLGWLLIPAERAVEVWEPLADPPAQPRRLEAATHLDAAPHFPGLAVNLEEIWAG